METKKLKHLEFLQAIIGRMASNSFLVKGWSVTLVSALFALSSKDANAKYIIIPYLIVPVFAVLDVYFLALEKAYRDLYKKVAASKEEPDFSLDASEFAKVSTFFRALISVPLLVFHGTLFGLVYLVASCILKQ